MKEKRKRVSHKIEVPIQVLRGIKAVEAMQIVDMEDYVLVAQEAILKGYTITGFWVFLEHDKYLLGLVYGF